MPPQTRGDCVAMKRRRKRSFGAHCGRGDSPGSNSAASIQRGNISSTSTVPSRGSRLNWTDSNTVFPNREFATRRANGFSRRKGSKSCGFGIINGGTIVKACCWKSGKPCIGARAVSKSCARFRIIVSFRPLRRRLFPGRANCDVLRPPSPPSDGGEGWGEEVRGRRNQSDRAPEPDHSSPCPLLSFRRRGEGGHRPGEAR